MRFNNVHSLYRMGCRASRHGHKRIAGLLRLYLRVVCTCDIPFEADIDDSVHFNHNGFGIVVNPSCRIGQNTEIQHSVTLGELRGGEMHRPLAAMFILEQEQSCLGKSLWEIMQKSGLEVSSYSMFLPMLS